jgi:hypothetical protein
MRGLNSLLLLIIASDTGPIRPINIQQINTILPKLAISEDMPTDKPTVPVAETTSKTR